MTKCTSIQTSILLLEYDKKKTINGNHKGNLGTIKPLNKWFPNWPVWFTLSLSQTLLLRINLPTIIKKFSAILLFIITKQRGENKMRKTLRGSYPYLKYSSSSLGRTGWKNMENERIADSSWMQASYLGNTCCCSLLLAAPCPLSRVLLQGWGFVASPHSWHALKKAFPDAWVSYLFADQILQRPTASSRVPRPTSIHCRTAHL